MAITPESYVGDDLTILVTVKNRAGAIVNVSSASVDAVANHGGVEVTPASVSVTDGPAGKITVDFARLLTSAGVWRVQVRATIGGDRQTVLYETHERKRSLL